MDPRKHVPNWLLERVALGEVPARRAADAERLKEDPAVRDRLTALEADSRRFLQEHPPSAVAAEVRRRFANSEQGRTGRLTWLWAVPVAAVVGLVAVTVIPRALVNPNVESTRIKGLQPHLVVYRKAGDGLERLDPNSEARWNDVLQLNYVAAGRKYGVVFSVDGRGWVTRHLPLNGGEAVALSGPGEVALPSSYQLDDAPSFERFFLITSGAGFDAEDAVKAARDLVRNGQARNGDLKLRSGLEQESVLILKVKP
jgi:hypothetical protein